MIQRVVLTFLLAFCFCGLVAQNLTDYAWLEGEWTYSEKENTTIESWSSRNDTVMVGISFTTNNLGDIISEEALRIQKVDGEVTYIAILPTKIATFKLTEHKENLLVFEDSSNDFPSLIHYKKQGAGLLVTLEGSGNKEVMEFVRKK